MLNTSHTLSLRGFYGGRLNHRKLGKVDALRFIRHIRAEMKRESLTKWSPVGVPDLVIQQQRPPNGGAYALIYDQSEADRGVWTESALAWLRLQPGTNRVDEKNVSTRTTRSMSLSDHISRLTVPLETGYNQFDRNAHRDQECLASIMAVDEVIHPSFVRLGAQAAQAFKCQEFPVFIGEDAMSPHIQSNLTRDIMDGQHLEYPTIARKLTTSGATSFSAASLRQLPAFRTLTHSLRMAAYTMFISMSNDVIELDSVKLAFATDLRYPDRHVILFMFVCQSESLRVFNYNTMTTNIELFSHVFDNHDLIPDYESRCELRRLQAEHDTAFPNADRSNDSSKRSNRSNHSNSNSRNSSNNRRHGSSGSRSGDATAVPQNAFGIPGARVIIPGTQSGDPPGGQACHVDAGRGADLGSGLLSVLMVVNPNDVPINSTQLPCCDPHGDGNWRPMWVRGGAKLPKIWPSAFGPYVLLPPIPSRGILALPPTLMHRGPRV